MFRIGEFSKLTQVSVRMLRYYDENGLLKPERIDPQTGYRLYSTGQISGLQRIVLLRDMDFSVAEIREALGDWRGDSVVKRLMEKQAEIEAEIQVRQARVSRIGIAIADLRDNRLETHYNVALRQIPACWVLSLRKKIPDHFCEGDLWRELLEQIHASKLVILPNLGSVAIFHDEEHRDVDVDVEAALVAPPGFGAVSGGLCFRELEAVSSMACVMVAGPYERIEGAYREFAHWMEDHGMFRLAGPVRQIVHRGAWDGAIPQDYLTEIQVPVEKAV